ATVVHPMNLSSYTQSGAGIVWRLLTSHVSTDVDVQTRGRPCSWTAGSARCESEFGGQCSRGPALGSDREIALRGYALGAANRRLSGLLSCGRTQTSATKPFRLNPPSRPH